MADLPPAALPAAWRLLLAAYDGTPCYLAEGHCTAHRWPGPDAAKLRDTHGVRCLNQLAPRVLEAESGGEVAVYPPYTSGTFTGWGRSAQPSDETPAIPDTDTASNETEAIEPPALTLGELWQALDDYGAEAEVLAYGLGKAIEADRPGVHGFRRVVEQALYRRRS
jgi:hypothetical protein